MKYGFTLAETLITLGVIGVVAALTMPALIQNHLKKETAVKLKQTYSLLMQGIRMAENELGEVETWQVDDSKTFSDTYIKPYFKITQEYKAGENPPGYNIYCQNGGVCISYGSFPSAQKLILVNGVLIAPFPYSYNISGQTYKSVSIIVDINGLKKPNRYGRDVFAFNTDAKKGLVPYGIGYVITQTTEMEHSRDFLMVEETRSCKRAGLYCAGVIMMDGWEIAEDSPW